MAREQKSYTAVNRVHDGEPLPPENLHRVWEMRFAHEMHNNHRPKIRPDPVWRPGHPRRGPESRLTLKAKWFRSNNILTKL